jgi:hypothetical protein
MPDRYTKAVLAVISAALIGLVVQNAIGPLNAQSTIQKVQICDPSGICASLSPYAPGGRPGSTTPSLYALSTITRILR